MLKSLRSKKLRPALWILGGLLFSALARDVLANGRPLYCRVAGKSFFPGLRTALLGRQIHYGSPALDALDAVEGGWKKFDYEYVLFAPIPFSPGEYMRDNVGKFLQPGQHNPRLPARFRHWLGTDELGHDVAAGLVAGARVAVLTGLTAMGMALLIGLLLGAVAGFYGDDRLRIRRGRWWATLLGLPMAWFYAATAREIFAERYGWSIAVLIFIGILLLFDALGRILSRFLFFSKPIVLPADLLVMRAAEVFDSIPALIFIIVVAALTPPQQQSIWLMVALIGLFSWTAVARFVRAELLRVRALDYVTAARGLGLSEVQILWRHALPNALRSTLIACAFGVAGAILLETSLSFLGFGKETLGGTSWGSLLSSSRGEEMKWWIALPPGLAISLTVLALNELGEILSEKK